MITFQIFHVSLCFEEDLSTFALSLKRYSEKLVWPDWSTSSLLMTPFLFARFWSAPPNSKAAVAPTCPAKLAAGPKLVSSHWWHKSWRSWSNTNRAEVYHHGQQLGNWRLPQARLSVQRFQSSLVLLHNREVSDLFKRWETEKHRSKPRWFSILITSR